MAKTSTTASHQNGIFLFRRCRHRLIDDKYIYSVLCVCDVQMRVF